MVDLTAYCIVVVCKLMRTLLKSLAALTKAEIKLMSEHYLQTVDLLVAIREIRQLVTEIVCPASLLYIDFAGECLEFVNVFRPVFFLNSQQLNVKLLLIYLRQESHQEF